jgi:hypothetical protein
MKIRNGFVTNSSSSSFIIAVKGGLANIESFIDIDNKKWKSFIANSIKQAFESSDGNDTDEAEELFSDEKGLKHYLEMEYSCKTTEEMTDYKNLIKDGFVFYRKNVSYHDHYLHKQINDMCDGKNIILVENNS